MLHRSVLVFAALGLAACGMPGATESPSAARVTDPPEGPHPACESLWRWACDELAVQDYAPESFRRTPGAANFEGLVEEMVSRTPRQAEYDARLATLGDPRRSGSIVETLARYREITGDPDQLAQHVDAHLVRALAGSDFSAYTLDVLRHFSYLLVSKHLDELRRDLEAQGVDTQGDLIGTLVGQRYPVTSTMSNTTPAQAQQRRVQLFDDVRRYLGETQYVRLVEGVLVADYLGFFYRAMNDAGAEFRARAGAAAYPPEVRRTLDATMDLVAGARDEAGTRRLGGLYDGLSAAALPASAERLEHLAAVRILYPDDPSFPDSIDIEGIVYGQHGRSAPDGLVLDAGNTDAPAAKLVYLIAHEYGHQLDQYDDDAPDRDGFAHHLRACLARPDAIDIRYLEPLRESAADWYAAEALARYVASRTDLTREQAQQIPIHFVNSCRPLETFRSGSHPRWDVRADRILMAHPFFRDLYGCEPPAEDGPIYCDPEDLPPYTAELESDE